MSRVSTKRALYPANAGTASMEFALVGTAFLLLLLGCMDLGRYFIVQHSVRTVAAEAARAAIVLAGSTACPQLSLSSATIKGKVAPSVPFLDPASLILTVVPTCNVDGTTTITASSQYAFIFVVPVWNFLNGNIIEITKMTYL